MKKMIFAVIVILLAFVMFKQNGYCSEKMHRVIRNCGIQDDGAINTLYGPCEHFDGSTAFILWPGQELIWDEMIYFSPDTPEKNFSDFFGFVPDCGKIEVIFGNAPMKNRCFQNGENEEVLYINYSRDYIVNALEKYGGFIHITIKNISNDPIVIFIKRLNSPPELKNGKKYLAIKRENFPALFFYIL